MEEGGVRVATLNPWVRNGAWEQRRSVLMEGLLGLQPDLIAFQEAIVGTATIRNAFSILSM
jgi:hypothetical protein